MTTRRPRRSRPAGAILAALFTIAVAACSGTSESTDPGPSFDTRTTEVAECPALDSGELDLEATANAPAAPPKPAQGEQSQTFNAKLPPPVPTADGSPIDLGDFPAARPAVLGADGIPASGDAVLHAAPADLRWEGTNQTAEPEVAVKGSRSLLVWNTMAAVSADGGASYQWLDPRKQFPAASSALCCDQRVLYLPRQDLWVWILQYELDARGDNTIRIAVAHGDDEFDRLRFRYADFGPAELGFRSGTLLDQPKVGATDRFLYVSLNGFTRSEVDPDRSPPSGSALLRLDLDDLAAGSVSSDCLQAGTNPADGTPYFGLMPTRSDGDTVYLAAHQDQAELAVWRWKDDEARPTFRTVSVRAASGDRLVFPETRPYTCPRTGGNAATDWCFRPVRGSDLSGNDGRITAGWVDRGLIGFAWNASQVAPDIAFPFVWVMLIDARTIDECDGGGCSWIAPIYDPRHAVQYAALGPNDAGVIGGVVLTGGGDRPLTCEAVVLDAATVAWRRVEIARSGADLPAGSTGRPSSGDYLGVASGGADAGGWVGSCMTWDPGSATEDGAMVIHTARFGVAP